jgi:hypothetical protein
MGPFGVDALAGAHSLIPFRFHSALTKAIQSPSFRIFVLKHALIRSTNSSRLLERRIRGSADPNRDVTGCPIVSGNLPIGLTIKLYKL